MQEINDKRTYTGKHFDNGDGSFTLRDFTKDIHYFNKLGLGDGEQRMREIDNTLQWDDVKKGWFFQFHSFQPFIPEYADEWAEFRDVFQEKDQSISYRPRCSHVKGRLVPSIENITDVNAVIYDDAFGEGFDLMYHFIGNFMVKSVRIRDGFKPTEDVSFDFSIRLSDPTMKVMRAYDNGDEYELDITKPKTFDSARTTKFEKREIKDKDPKKKYDTVLREFRVWDSSENIQTEIINVDFDIDEEGVFFRKHITAEFLAKSIGDVLTDTTTSYGMTSNSNQVVKDAYGSTYLSGHDAAVGDAVYTAYLNGNNNMIHNTKSGSIWFVRRGQYEFTGTSGIGSGMVVSACRFYLNTASSGGGDDDGDSVVLLDNTNNANLNNPLVTEDFNDFGSTSIGERDNTVFYNAGAFNYIDLTTFAAINMTGTTLIGIRFKNDIDSVAPTGSNVLRVVESTTPLSGTYIEVTYAAAPAGGNSNFLAIM